MEMLAEADRIGNLDALVLAAVVALDKARGVDRTYTVLPRHGWAMSVFAEQLIAGFGPVSYTHLTLPTICSV